MFINAPLEADALRAVVEDTEALLPEGAWPIWTASNHDVSRLATRWAAGDPAKVKLALLLMLTLRGTPFLYAGDEIGLVDGPVQREDVLDAGRRPLLARLQGPRRRAHADAVERRARRRLHRGGRATVAARWPTRPQCNVADQEGDPDSVLELCRRTIAARQASEDLAVGSYRSLPSPDGHVGLRRGVTARRCCSTCRRRPASFDGVAGTVAVSTEHALEGSSVEGALTLPPWAARSSRRPDGRGRRRAAA